MSWSKHIFLSALLLSLAGCGFHPLYAERDLKANEPLLAAIKVTPISERVGQQLEFALREELNPTGLQVPSLYTLTITLIVASVDTGIQRDASATRGNTTVYATFTLTEIKTNKQLYASRTQSTSAYNILFDPYAAQVATDDSLTRAVRELSGEIGTRLALFLRQQRAG